MNKVIAYECMSWDNTSYFPHSSMLCVESVFVEKITNCRKTLWHEKVGKYNSYKTCSILTIYSNLCIQINQIHHSCVFIV